MLVVVIAHHAGRGQESHESSPCTSKRSADLMQRDLVADNAIEAIREGI